MIHFYIKKERNRFASHIKETDASNTHSRDVTNSPKKLSDYLNALKESKLDEMINVDDGYRKENYQPFDKNKYYQNEYSNYDYDQTEDYYYQTDNENRSLKKYQKYRASLGIKSDGESSSDDLKEKTKKKNYSEREKSSKGKDDDTLRGFIESNQNQIYNSTGAYTEQVYDSRHLVKNLPPQDDYPYLFYKQATPAFNPDYSILTLDSFPAHKTPIPLFYDPNGGPSNPDQSIESKIFSKLADGFDKQQRSREDSRYSIRTPKTSYNPQPKRIQHFPPDLNFKNKNSNKIKAYIIRKKPEREDSSADQSHHQLKKVITAVIEAIQK